MLKSGREKTILKQSLVAVVILVGLYLFVLNPFLKEGSSILDEELERKTNEIERIISHTGALPSKESFTKFEGQKLEIESELQKLADFIDPLKVRISESSTEAGLYFIERLHGSTKKFSKEAQVKGIKLPENLGFGDGLPKESMVDLLLRQLEVVELVMDILLKSRNVEFSAIKPLKSIDYIESLSKEILYVEVPVQISIKADTDVLIDLLLELKNKSPMVSVKEVHIRSSEFDGDDYIEASLVLSAFKVIRPGKEKIKTEL
ncbi:MAG: Amuc_1100 family pilus-like protein [Candidatus Omnitrophica bacterium]|nr:Amuc_1100 family pilus-like protein [Candidatus Omnitrophota bacterium]